MAVPAGDRFLVEPTLTVKSTPPDDFQTHSGSARLNGISSRSIAKKYCRNNTPSVYKKPELTYDGLIPADSIVCLRHVSNKHEKNSKESDANKSG